MIFNYNNDLDTKQDIVSSILSLYEDAETPIQPQINFYNSGETDPTSIIYQAAKYLYFQGADCYYFFDNIQSAGNIYSAGKGRITDGKGGCGLLEGFVYIQGGESTNPEIRFLKNGSTEYDSRIYYNGTKMLFSGSEGYHFDENIKSERGIYSYGKGSITDGLAGCVLFDGIATLQGGEYSPQVRFFLAGSTSYDSRIVLDTEKVLQFLDAVNYRFDSNIISTNGILTNGKTTYSDGKIGIQLAASGNIHAQHASAPSLRFYVGESTTSDTGRITVNSSDQMKFTNSTRYQFDAQLYSTTSIVATSDRNKKKDFAEFDARYENLFFDLKPQIYKFKDGTSDRFHSGFISQDVEESMIENNLDSKDFAGYCKEIQRKVIIDTDEEYLEENVYDENGNLVYDYMLRYEEFIALNTHMLQKAYKEIDALKTIIDEMKKEIDILKS